MGFFAIMNPVANTPIFLSLTNGDDRPMVKLLALRSLLIAFLIVVVFSITGKVIFEVFGITMAAFRITGGLLVFLIGFQMLHGQQSKVHQTSEENRLKSREAALDVAVSPLAMPILAGPGTISTAMNFSAGQGIEGMLVTILAFAILCGITYALFVFGGRFVKFIGPAALGAITRIMGLILAVIGIQMVIEGLREAFGTSLAL
ncbi:conserved hypothetical protein TIGR00427 [Verrucomicrobiia bacterium DG1235]|nr:conserved hypothetical protein TIGR00427 [Verrucomicrobiae bacterium DG1235]